MPKCNLSIFSFHVILVPILQMWMNVNLEPIAAVSLHSVSTPLGVTCASVAMASLGTEETALVSFSPFSKLICAYLYLLEDSLLSLLGIFFPDPVPFWMTYRH